MLKSFLLFFAVALLAIACSPFQGGSPQQTAPAPAPATTPAPTPAPALTPPETAAPPPAAPVKNPVKPTAESQAKAKALYRMDCAMCHGDNGNGKTDLATNMELTLDDWTHPKRSPQGGLGVVQHHSRRQRQDASRIQGPRHRQRGLEPRHLHSHVLQIATSGAGRSAQEMVAPS